MAATMQKFGPALSSPLSSVHCGMVPGPFSGVLPLNVSPFYVFLKELIASEIWCLTFQKMNN